MGAGLTDSKTPISQPKHEMAPIVEVAIAPMHAVASSESSQFLVNKSSARKASRQMMMMKYKQQVKQQRKRTIVGPGTPK